MKKLFFVTIMVVTAAQLMFAQTRTQKSLLWEISGNGLKHSSYIFGSLHAIDTTEFMLPPEIFELLGKCDKAAFELDITDYNLISRLDLSQATKGEKGKFLMSSLDNDYREKLKKILHHEKNNVVMTMLKEGVNDDINPYYLMNMITVAAQMRSTNNNYAMDIELIKYAKRGNKAIISLETPEEQILCLSGNMLGWEEKIAALKKSIDEYLQDNLSSKKMYDAYRNQNLEEVLGYLQDPFFTQRNHNMVNRLIPVMKEGRTFVVVGAAHLPFENGALQLLRKKGFTINPVYVDLIRPSLSKTSSPH
jgi:uncharacterized protein YbaP (TraB family)